MQQKTKKRRPGLVSMLVISLSLCLIQSPLQCNSMRIIQESQSFTTVETASSQPIYQVTVMTQNDIEEEKRYDDMALVAQLVQAEAGNQGLDGMRLVADVILNRLDSDQFPDTIEGVIYQKGQFGPMVDGAFERAGYNMSEDAYKAVEMEWDQNNRWNTGILYFNTSWDNGTDPFKFGDHYFSY